MSESTEQTGDAATTPVETGSDADTVRVVEAKPNRLYQAAAWVAIVAGSLFIVTVIFFAGFTMGKHSGGPHFDRHGGHGTMMQRQGPPMGPWHHRPGSDRGPGDGPGMRMPGGPDRGVPGNPGNPGNPGSPGGPGNPGQPPQTPPSR